MNYAIILAGGYGQRMSMRKDKMMLLAGGKPIIYYSLSAFNDHPEIDKIILIASQNNLDDLTFLVAKYKFKKVKATLIGGMLRQKSLEKAMEAIEDKAKDQDLVLVHNGANPLPSHQEISETIKKAKETGAAIVGRPVKSTIKEVDETHVLKTHDRKNLFAAETPQCAQYKLLKEALENAQERQLEVTDEAMLLEAINQPVAHVLAHEENFKITTQSDYHKLRSILGDVSDDFRIGIGQDSHQFEDHKKGLYLAGIHLPEQKAMQANSDGDVVLHAIFNAISQAIGDKSLGYYADPMCEQGITNSKEYLKVLLKKLKTKKFTINTIGVMIECKTPKIDPISYRLKKSLAEFFKISENRIGITATSGENLTAFGAGLGIQSFAIVSLKAEKND